jgi:hypothetical protein
MEAGGREACGFQTLIEFIQIDGKRVLLHGM